MTMVRFSRPAPVGPSAPRERALDPRRTEPPLPAEIAFMIGAGVSPACLLEAGRLAERSKVSADVALLASGLVSEAAFYRALARRLGTEFLEGPIDVLLNARPDVILATGVAPLRGNPGGFTHLVAPRGTAVTALLQGRRNPRSRPSFVVATPRQLACLVRAADAGRIAREASLALPRRDRDLSSLSRLTSTQVGTLALASCAAGFASVMAPGGLGLAAGAIFLPSILLRLAAAAASRPPRRVAAVRRSPDAELPVYTVLVPLFREARVVRRLVRALDRLDYPAARLDILFLLEAGDRETHTALVAMALPTRYRILTVPPGQPQTKPRALNVGLQSARGELLVVFDAEDEPDPGQLRAAAAQFASAPERLACLQAKLAIRDSRDSALATLFAIEYCALFDVVNSGLARLRMPILLGGTSNHFRTETLHRLVGWDAWNVTEDADLGLRLARSGYAVEMLDSTTFEEAPHNWTAWLKQRTRWQKGYMQTLAVHSRAPMRLLRELGALRALGALSLLSGSILGALFGPSFAALMAWRAWAGTPAASASGLDAAAVVAAWTVFGLGVACVAWPVALGRMRRPWLRLLPGVAAAPLYWVLLSVAAWLALLEITHLPFRWAKTEHGLGRSARRRADAIAALPHMRDAGEPPLPVRAALSDPRPM